MPTLFIVLTLALLTYMVEVEITEPYQAIYEWRLQAIAIMEQLLCLLKYLVLRENYDNFKRLEDFLRINIYYFLECLMYQH